MKDIQNKISSYICSILSDFDCSLNFEPLANINKAHLHSDALFRYAKSNRQNPTALSNQLKTSELDTKDYKVVFEAGHINIFLLKTDLKFELPKSPKKACIIITEICAAVEFRTLASAYVEYLLAEGSEIEFYLLNSVGELLSIDPTANLDCIINKSRTKIKLEDYIALVSKCLNAETIFNLWIPPKYFDRTEFNKLYHAFILDSESEVYLHCYEKLFVGTPEKSLLEAFKQSTSPKETALMLASSRLTEELSLAEAKLLQKNNLIWYLSSMNQRMEQICSPDDFNFELIELKKLPVNHQKLCLRLEFLPFFIEEAVLRGKIRQFLDLLAEYLDYLSHFFNNPDFRCRLGEGRLEKHELQIISGALIINKVILRAIKVA